MNYLLATVYIVNAILIAGILLTLKVTNTNYKEAFYCVLTGIFWPISMPALTGALMVSTVMGRIKDKRQRAAVRLWNFTEFLHKIGILNGKCTNEILKNLHARL